MSKKHLIVYAVLIILAGGSLSLLFLNTFENSPPLDQLDPKVRVPGTHPPGKSLVHLYFADKDNSFLLAEERVLFRSADPAELGKTIIESLIRGPQEKLMRTIPAEAVLRALYVTQDGTAHVDFTEAVKEKHPGGSKSELMTIYSIVNSLILNISEINTVKILISGSESMTLAGHIDLRFPFKADMLLIR